MRIPLVNFFFDFCSYMRRCVWLQPEQAADLQALGVDDPGTDKVLRVGVDALHQREAVAD